MGKKRSDPEMDEPVRLPADPEEALKAMLAIPADDEKAKEGDARDA